MSTQADDHRRTVDGHCWMPCATCGQLQRVTVSVVIGLVAGSPAVIEAIAQGHEHDDDREPATGGG